MRAMNRFLYSSLVVVRVLVVILLSASMVFLFIDANQVQGQTSQFSTTEIDRYIQQEMSRTQLPGMAVAIVRGQEIVYLKGFGYASLKTKSSVTPQTIFDLASCSKSFTALAVLTLWHDGLIDLDKPLAFYIPEFRLADEDGPPIITIRQLLNQTSGLPGDISEPVSYHTGSNAMNALVAAMARVHSDRAPGSSFEYANFNYNLLGALIERVSGQYFEDYVQEHVLEPLGMGNSTLRPEIAARGDRADGHQLLLGHVVVRNTPVYRSAIPAGWVMSSAEDMAKWLITNLNDGVVDGRQVVPADLITLMHTTAVTSNEDGKELGYGMGWFTGLTSDGKLVYWHGGDTPNFLSEMILLPDEKLGIVMLANGQTCQGAHNIATGITSLALGLQFELPQSPWWASWKSVDNISISATILSALLILGLIPFIILQLRVVKRLRQQNIENKATGRKLKIWWVVVPATPWVIFAIIATVAYAVMQSLFGFNIFTTIVRFGYFAPPGTLVAAISIVVALFLWSIALSMTAILRALARVSAISKT
jgi:CubicO group peptidase (beta-lactamase class C family)